MEALGLSGLFGGCYSGRRVLVTGHTGFKGSWLALWLHSLGAEVAGLALDPEHQPSHWDQLGLPLAMDARTDLRDATAVQAALDAFQPEVVFHLAAQALVRRSYRDPAATFASNVGGVVNLFEAVRHCPSVRAVVNATTDKVYESHASPQGYREVDPLGGHDPYSASKACSEIVSASYRLSFFARPDAHGRRVGLATARAGNVVGGGDWAEDRLVPDLVRAASTGSRLVLRNPAATRPWQHVLEPLSGYLLLGQKLLAGEAVDQAWNFGPSAGATLDVAEVVRRLQAQWPGFEVSHDDGPHPHEAAQLALDCTKAEAGLGWRPVWDASDTLQRTVDWYRAMDRDGELRSHDDLAAYVHDARRAGLAWAS
ncbi:MAG: CDP-glucose 4,6-dehydratase [Arenimonas sp.]|nr:CDP-glucose 4,6-dehydratase [Arenimonas sp.]